MAHYLGAGITMLATGLAPDVLVVVGEVTRIWDKLRPTVTETLCQGQFRYASSRILATDPGTQPHLRGAMASILQKHFNSQWIG